MDVAIEVPPDDENLECGATDEVTPPVVSVEVAEEQEKKIKKKKKKKKKTATGFEMPS
jgi:hypothetical protein